MAQTISIGKQDFLYLRENNYFYIDKTDFIRQWWESADDITLITRPRRFGKTLNMSMLNYFFSNHYSEKSEIFEKLSIWNSEKYRRLQGAYPVIFISFADVKQGNYKDAVQKVKKIIADVYRQYRYLMDYPDFTVADRRKLSDMTDRIDDVTAQDSLKDLSYFLSEYYKKKVIILLDEYDTPMQEAYIHGYWDEFVNFMRGLLNSTFKTNPYMERAIMTGITKEETSSPLDSEIPRQVDEMGFPTRLENTSPSSQCHNLVVVTTTSEQYADCFGFTEKEVFESIEKYGMSDKKAVVKQWYDGFTFGSLKDIYNPWSITNFLKEKKLKPYWAATSSNALISRLIQESSAEIKSLMESLVNGKSIEVNFDEQIVFNRLEKDESAIWSLLLASGYLKVDSIVHKGMTLEPWYRLSITNLETISMFSNLFKGWFADVSSNYNEFVKALFSGDVKAMNVYMNDVAMSTFSSFDTGNHPSDRSQPERFYHGFVLGLLVDIRDNYEVLSNRESGFGRYDVVLVPREKGRDAFVMEFKVFDDSEESGLEDTVAAALRQIDEKNYDTQLLDRGISENNIKHYGFAFCGKKVLIGC